MNKPTQEAFDDFVSSLEDQEEFLSDGEWRELLVKIKEHVEELLA